MANEIKKQRNSTEMKTEIAVEINLNRIERKMPSAISVAILSIENQQRIKNILLSR